MTDATFREQGGHSVWEHHNPARDLGWAEIMPEPLDWDAWCWLRAEREAALLPDVHSVDTGCAPGQADTG